MNKIFALAGLMGCALASGAYAQDTAGAATWTGPYVGLHAGYGKDDDRFVLNNPLTAGNTAAINGGVVPYSLRASREGAVGGAQLGYNMQYGNGFVTGLEADWSLLNSDGEATYVSATSVPAGRQSHVTHDLQWLSSLRARVGHTMGDRALFYATGGYAIGRVKDTAVFNGANPATIGYGGANKYNANGWIGGAGVQYALGGGGWMGRTSMRLEYLHYDLGDKTLFAAPIGGSPGGYVTRSDTKGDIMRAGVDFRF